MIRSHLQIRSNGYFCTLGQVDDTNLRSLPTNDKLHCIELDARPIKACELRYTKTSGIDTLKYGEISLILDAVMSNAFEELHDFFCGKESDLSILFFDEIDGGGIDTGNSFLFEKLEKGPKCDHIGICRLYRQSFLSQKKTKLI